METIKFGLSGRYAEARVHYGFEEIGLLMRKILNRNLRISLMLITRFIIKFAGFSAIKNLIFLSYDLTNLLATLFLVPCSKHL